MNKIYTFIIFSEQEKMFCIRQFEEDKSQEFKDVGYKIVNYTGDEITGADIELYQDKGYKYDPTGWKCKSKNY